VVGTIKRSSSVWIKEQPWAYRNIDFKEFSWQNGYGVFSVSGSRKGVVAEYIDNQMEHHKRQSFQDEYRMFLKKHGLDFDERYVWD
jgi:REP element-mobilizing transposase RayT